MTSKNTADIRHAALCQDCDRLTFMYERYCHHCGADRWDR